MSNLEYDLWLQDINRGFHFQKTVILIFGISLIMTAIFSHAPLDRSLAFSSSEDQLHSVFASITGFSFTFFAVSIGFIEKRLENRLLAFLVALLATILSLLIFNIEIYSGIWQRLIFIISFGWLIYECGIVRISEN